MLKEISPAYHIVSSTTLSNTTFSCSASGVQFKDSIAYQVNWTGLPTALVSVDGSVDFNPGLPQTGQFNAGNWCTITSQTIASGTAQPILFNLTQIAAPWTRLTMTVSSGTSTFSAYFMAKSLG